MNYVRLSIGQRDWSIWRIFDNKNAPDTPIPLRDNQTHPGSAFDETSAALSPGIPGIATVEREHGLLRPRAQQLRHDLQCTRHGRIDRLLFGLARPVEYRIQHQVLGSRMTYPQAQPPELRPDLRHHV